MIFYSLLLLFQLSFAETIAIGSKKFAESFILAEIFAQSLEEKGHDVKRRFGLGGTLVAYEALNHGEIDVYPEYTGTLAQVIIKNPDLRSVDELNDALPKHLAVMDSLGFNNTYAVAVPKARAESKGWERVSDLAQKNLRIATNYEFVNREDGWQGFQKTYQTHWETVVMEHSLSYKALQDGKADLINIYSTDPKVITMNLKIMEDDKKYFPQYLAIPFYNKKKESVLKEAIKPFIGNIDSKLMIQMNAMVEEEGKSFSEVATWFFNQQSQDGQAKKHFVEVTWFKKHWLRLKEHLILTFSGLFLSCMFSFIATFFILKNEKVAFVVMSFAGLLQTIPSIALLAFMIPLFGIGLKSAIIALFLYSILPVLRNTYIAFEDFDPVLEESARSLGLYPWESLLYIKLPIVMPIILAGIKTAAVISIGTATLAAFIGAGGLGEPIVTGLSLNNTQLILEGAVPAAALALLTEFSFSALEKFLDRKKSS